MPCGPSTSDGSVRIHSVGLTETPNEHISAIFRHLPPDIQGRHFNPPTRLHARLGIAPDDVVLAADWLSVLRAGQFKTAYVEHGAAQSYAPPLQHREAHCYYHPRPGAENHHPDNVIAYIAPRQDVIDAWGRPGFAAGCPAVDEFELVPSEPRTIAFTFHWMAHRVCPEATSAFGHYEARLPDIIAKLKADDWTVIGTRHPRFKHLKGYWERLGVEEVGIDDVRRRASTLILDNSSAGFEHAYLLRRTVWLNAPHYRRDVEHGLRFWSHVPGIQVDSPDELLEVLPGLDPEVSWDWDPDTIGYVYGKAHSDGHDGLRAASWLCAFLSSADVGL